MEKQIIRWENDKKMQMLDARHNEVSSSLLITRKIQI